MQRRNGTDTGRALRAAGYSRVSTGRQAVHDLSIPYQQKQISAYCDKNGWDLAESFVDAKTGTDDNRPEFQRMIDLATNGRGAFDVIVVHSFSRFYRDEVGLTLHVRDLVKHGVKLVSITQEVGDGTSGDLLRRVIALLDEHGSKETAKHVSRGLRENARQGFFNGSTPPYGYVAAAAEQRGDTVKKKLAIEPGAAEVVRKIFQLYLRGDGATGPLGVQRLTGWLNEHGYRTLRGARWGVRPVHRMLADPAYKGDYIFNRHGPEEERIHVEVPAIVSEAEFDLVQALLRSRNPKVQPPRVVSGPNLLTGLVKCALCGGGMTHSGGTSKTGKFHHYYSCSTRMRCGKSACPGMSIPMPELDMIVTERLRDQVLTPKRMRDLLDGLLQRQAKKNTEGARHLDAMRARLSEAESGLKRLYDAIADGIIDASDPTLKERVAARKNERDIAHADYERAASELTPDAKITEAKIAEFTDIMREKIMQGPVETRKLHLRAVVDTVEVSAGSIKIIGRKSVIQTLVTDPNPVAAGVRPFVRNWRRDRDSNPGWSHPHNGFRDRPVRPLRHLSSPATCIRAPVAGRKAQGVAQQAVRALSTITDSTSSGSRFHQSPAEKISTSARPSKPSASTIARIPAMSITPSPIIPRSVTRSFVGFSQSQMWNAIRRARPARRICAAKSGSHQT